MCQTGAIQRMRTRWRVLLYWLVVIQYMVFWWHCGTFELLKEMEMFLKEMETLCCRSAAYSSGGRIFVIEPPSRPWKVINVTTVLRKVNYITVTRSIIVGTLNAQSLGNKSVGRRSTDDRRQCFRFIRRRWVLAWLRELTKRRHIYTTWVLCTWEGQTSYKSSNQHKNQPWRYLHFY